MTDHQYYTNNGTLEITGEIDLSAAAAVSANRGEFQTAAKTATGTYTVTIPAAVGVTLVERLKSHVMFTNTVPATATGCRISAVALDASNNLVITIKTSASPTTGADTDTTAATTLSFAVQVRMWKMGNPL